MTCWIAAFALLMASIFSAAARAEEPAKVSIGSKTFTESVILADMAGDLAASTGAHVVRHDQLGGTRILWDALLAGQIDIYPEYTGTLLRELLANDHIGDMGALERALAERGLRMSAPLGFNNTYALGVMPGTAQRFRLSTISDLAKHPGLRYGFSNEFLDRADGWPSLRRAYGLSPTNVRGFEHDLTYPALADGSIDVIDLYTTDAEIAYYGIKVLEDDRHHFPDYKAVLLYRADLERRAPKALTAMLRLVGKIDNRAMIALNRAAKLDRKPENVVAAGFVASTFGVAADAQTKGLSARILQRTKEHLWLTVVSLAAAIALAIPLGVVAARRPRTGQLILAAVGVVQTIPSLAVLVFMIPLLGIGGPPAIAALFLYSLLPIVRNTAAGLTSIPPSIRNSAIALGLGPERRLWRVELPIASPSILAGIKTAAVINVGTATLGALIGAGGYGQPILTGIRLADFGLILEGAVPAAALALVVQGLFELAERWLVPRGLRLKTTVSV